MTEREDCLNCPLEECTGNYPACLNQRVLKGGYVPRDGFRDRKLAALKHGETTQLICFLAKIGLNRTQICDICETSRDNVKTHLMRGVRIGLISKQQSDASRTRPYVRRSPESKV